jgi:hypothetical protein
MEPHPSLDAFRLREIEKELFRELETARQQVRAAANEEEKSVASEAHNRALQRFTDFVARKIVPEEFLQ